jgi:hypothetical protein
MKTETIKGSALEMIYAWPTINGQYHGICKWWNKNNLTRKYLVQWKKGDTNGPHIYFEY